MNTVVNNNNVVTPHPLCILTSVTRDILSKTEVHGCVFVSLLLEVLLNKPLYL